MHEIILHHYPRSPYAEKIRVALGLKGLAWRSVQIPPWMPKPELMPLTGGYRRAPVMQVGADVFCDTLLILRQIERMQPSPAFFPPGAEALATALGWSMEKTLFVPVIGIIVGLTGQNYPRGLVEDRLPFFGFSLEHADMLAKQAQFVNRLNVHLAWLGDMLVDGRPFLLGAAPCAADLCAYHPLWHLRRAGGDAAAAEQVLKLVPALHPLLPWLDRMGAIGHGTMQELSGAEALEIAARTVPMEPDSDLAAAPLHGLKPGDQVSVTPDDHGRDAVTGRLLAVTAQEIVLRRHDERLGEINIHFPRAGFDAAMA